MAELTNAAEFSVREVTELLLRERGFTEGLFDLALEFSIGTGLMGPNKENLGPGLAFSLKSFTLRSAPSLGPLTIDASQVGPVALQAAERPHSGIAEPTEGYQMASKKTGPEAARSAGKVLSSKATGSASKSAAASALTQRDRAAEKTSAKAATAASKVLRDGRTSKDSKSAAGSALSQRPTKKR